MKWTEPGEPPGWYRARIDQYFIDRTCKMIYYAKSEHIVSEVVAVDEMGWKLCSSIDVIRIHGLETRIQSFGHPWYGHMMHGVKWVSVLPTNDGLVSNILVSELKNIPYKRPRCTKASLSYNVVGLSASSVVHVTFSCPIFILIPCAIIISTRSLHLVSLLSSVTIVQ